MPVSDICNSFKAAAILYIKSCQHNCQRYDNCPPSLLCWPSLPSCSPNSHCTLHIATWATHRLAQIPSQPSVAATALTAFCCSNYKEPSVHASMNVSPGTLPPLDPAFTRSTTRLNCCASAVVQFTLALQHWLPPQLHQETLQENHYLGMH